MTDSTSPFSLAGKKGLILGLANEHSIAWGCAQLAHQQGAQVVTTCLNDKARNYVAPLTQPLGMDLVTCNVEDAGALDGEWKRWFGAPDALRVVGGDQSGTEKSDAKRTFGHETSLWLGVTGLVHREVEGFGRRGTRPRRDRG